MKNHELKNFLYLPQSNVIKMNEIFIELLTNNVLFYLKIEHQLECFLKKNGKNIKTKTSFMLNTTVPYAVDFFFVNIDFCL